jgi:hypothetical protein
MPVGFSIIASVAAEQRWQHSGNSQGRAPVEAAQTANSWLDWVIPAVFILGVERLKESAMYGLSDLKPELRVTATTVECPVAGCRQLSPYLTRRPRCPTGPARQPSEPLLKAVGGAALCNRCDCMIWLAPTATSQGNNAGARVADR